MDKLRSRKTISRWATSLTIALGLLLVKPIYAQQVATTLLSVGEVSAHNQQQQARALQRRSPVFNADTIHTGAASSAQFRFIDGALLAVSESSQVEVVDYRFDEQSQTGRSWLNLIEGGIRTMTGSIGDNSVQDYELRTPVGTIGIRGTDFQLHYADEELFVAVWESDIVVKVIQAGKITEQVELGLNRPKRYARISRKGKVRLLDEPPKVLVKGSLNKAGGKASSGGSGGDSDKKSKQDKDKPGNDNKNGNKDPKKSKKHEQKNAPKTPKKSPPPPPTAKINKSVKQSLRDQRNRQQLNPPVMEPMSNQ